MKQYLQRFLLLALWEGAGPVQAQRLLWETTYTTTGTAPNALLACGVTATGQVIASGVGSPAASITCPVYQPYQALYRLYSAGGVLLHSQPGRGLDTGDQAFCRGAAGRYWWVGNTQPCGGGSQSYSSYLQRVTAGADTLASRRVLTAGPPANWGFAALAASQQVLVAGVDDGAGGINRQFARFALTAVDTATGQVHWRYAYNRPGFANDVAIGLTRTPRGGYLLTGDGQLITGGFQHLLLETDSLGRQLKQQLIYPLGPNFADPNAHGARKASDVITNIVTLPNAQGYLTTGVADSVSNNGTSHNQRAYLMRLDTALHVTWVYRNPPDVYGTGNRNQRANKVRLLGNGTAVYLVQDVRGTGVADLQLVQVELATGRAVNRAVLSSNTQAAVLAFDWDFVGDGTLVVCGKSTQVGVAAQQGWLARFDLRGTALLAARPGAAAGAAVQVWPVPAHEAVNVAWPAGWEATRVEVRDGLGRLGHSQGVGVGQRTAAVGLGGLVPGVYVLRVLGQQGAVSKRLVVE